ncbi:MAG: DUF1127 domain-containing protein [Paracoccaceae bacterium]
MAIFETIRPITFGTRFATRLTAVSSAFFDAVSEWNDIRATRISLGALSDVQLDDIGLTRGDIDAIKR